MVTNLLQLARTAAAFSELLVALWPPETLIIVLDVMMRTVREERRAPSAPELAQALIKAGIRVPGDG